jgi:hypothetical protein
MAYQPSGPISALGAFGPRADMGPLGLIYHAIWILACIILYRSGFDYLSDVFSYSPDPEVLRRRVCPP